MAVRGSKKASKVKTEEPKELTTQDKYIQKMNDVKVKYKDAIYALCTKYDKDLGVGYDMLLAIARGNEEYGQGININLEELKKDCNELNGLYEQLKKERGQI